MTTYRITIEPDPMVLVILGTFGAIGGGVASAFTWGDKVHPEAHWVFLGLSIVLLLLSWVPVLLSALGERRATGKELSSE